MNYVSPPIEQYLKFKNHCSLLFTSSLNICPEACCERGGAGGVASPLPPSRPPLVPADPWIFHLKTKCNRYSPPWCFLHELIVGLQLFLALSILQTPQIYTVLSLANCGTGGGGGGQCCLIPNRDRDYAYLIMYHAISRNAKMYEGEIRNVIPGWNEGWQHIKKIWICMKDEDARRVKVLSSDKEGWDK